MFIYKITNKINDKIYIGQTIRSINLRWNEHICSKSGGESIIKNALLKHGKDNFLMEVIYEAKTIEELNSKEEELINKFNSLAPNGYNLRQGGKNRKMSDITKQKMSLGALRRIRTPHSEETKNKMSISSKGKPKSAKHRANLSASLGKPVICNETKTIYPSAKAAALDLGVTGAGIGRNISGKIKTIKGFTFSFHKE